MIGDRIKTLRTLRNLSQVELAKKLNVSKQSVSNWENDNILPSVEVVKQLAEFFSCRTDYLLGLEDDKNYIEVNGLNDIQLVHVQNIIDDLRRVNSSDNAKKTD
ncbi:MAG: helix-turn-helix transcriptional regulator [Lachnospiraceae bacterium]|nr:helix-turn-helix transcriptional regulator [Lachnospiraceae bacterium]